MELEKRLNNADYFSVNKDIGVYNFIEGKRTEYRHTYLNPNLTELELSSSSGKHKLKSEWTELRAYDFSRKYNVSIFRTSKRTRRI